MDVCPSCGVGSPVGSPTCGVCGSQLPQARTLGGADERKVVSVLFADLAGFTAASESADPEDVRARLVPFHDASRAAVGAYGGTLEKFAGDAVMAVFGAPVAHEDDAERAVRAGLRILESLAAQNATKPSLDLHARVGVNTGEVLVALDARPEAGEAFVAGDVVNTAARIQTAAPVDAVAVSEATHRATMRVFDYERLRASSMKGKTGDVALWRAGSPRARLGTDVIRSSTTRLIGRSEELTQLIDTFARACRERTTQLVTVIGEPGLGKSRLVAEFLAVVEDSPEMVTWRQGRCLAYGQGIAFWALGELVKAHAGILPTDSAATVGAKLDATLADDERKLWLRMRLLPLLGVDTGTAASRDEAFSAWGHFVGSFARSGPAVVVLEDLHWADDAMLAFIEHLASHRAGLPLVIVATSRPELLQRQPDWAADLPQATSVRLSALSDDETVRLIGSLVHQVTLSPDTQRSIVQRCGGNPLYAEEFVRMLQDSELLGPDGELRPGAAMPLPDSVHDIIAARLDTLQIDQKALLQDAAVMGKVFSDLSLLALRERETTTTTAQLQELVRLQLVRQFPSSGSGTEYGFWHEMVRDVAYSEIPRRQRAARHAAAADWLAHRSDARPEDTAELVFHHLDTAFKLASELGDADLAEELKPRVRDSAMLSAAKAIKLDTDQARTFLDRALELTPHDEAEYGTVLLRWGRGVLQAGHFAEADDALTHAATALKVCGNVFGAAEALIYVGHTRASHGGGRDFIGPLEEAVRLLQPLRPGSDLVEALGQLGTAYMLAGRAAEAIETANQSVNLATQLNLPVPASALSGRGSARVDCGDAGGMEDLEGALANYLAADDVRAACITWNNLSCDQWVMLGPRVALETTTAAMAFARPRHVTEVTMLLGAMRPMLLVETGHLADAIAEAVELLPQVHDRAAGKFETELLVSLACACSETGNDQQEYWADRAVSSARNSRDSDWFVVGVRPAATVWSTSQKTEQAHDLLCELVARDDPVTSTYATALPSLVRAANRCGDLDLAVQLVGPFRARSPLGEHALVSAAALIAEARGDHEQAAVGFDEAVARWTAFDNKLEAAYARFGQGRCHWALGDPKAEATLRAAEGQFRQMGAVPAAAECERMLAMLP